MTFTSWCLQSCPQDDDSVGHLTCPSVDGCTHLWRSGEPATVPSAARPFLGRWQRLRQRAGLTRNEIASALSVDVGHIEVSEALDHYSDLESAIAAGIIGQHINKDPALILAWARRT